MTQEQFSTTIKILRSGAPALAEELCGAVAGLVNLCQEQAKELEEVKRKLTETTSVKSVKEAK